MLRAIRQMYGLHRPILLLALLFSAFGSVHAERLPLRTYTSADGLGSSFVDYLMRDSRGFMWFCTRDGLSRFDGSRFVTYRIGDQSGPPGIEEITETRNGVYWITTTGGLYRLKANELSRPELNGSITFLKAELISSRRGAIFEDRAGNIWRGDDDLYRMQEINGRIEFQKASLNLRTSAKAPLRILQMREAPDASFWIYTNRGLVRRLPDGRCILYEHEPSGPGRGSMLIDPTGRVLVIWAFDFFIINPPPLDALDGLGSMTVQELRASSIASMKVKQAVRLPERAGEILQLKMSSSAGTLQGLFQTSDGHIWITATDDLLEFDGRVFHAYNGAQGLPANLGRLAADTAGNLWIGGVNLIRLDRKGLTSFGPADGLNSSTLYAIDEATDGTLYFANGDFYLSRFDGERFLTRRAAIVPHSLALWSSRFAFLSRENEWWILTSSRLYRFAASDLQTPIATYDHRDGFKADRMFQIFEDSHGDIWLSQLTSSGDNSGLYRLKHGEKKFQAFSEAENFPPGRAASSFAEDQKGDLWISFYEGGLARFANNRFAEFTAKDGAPAGMISDLLLDQRGRLWLSSSNGGLSRVDDPHAERPVFIALTTADGLASNNVRTITEDTLGNIYVGTARGVDRISPDTKHIKHYSVADGLAADFIVDSHRDRSGALWFATTGGLSRLVPQNEEITSAPPIWIGGLRIAGEPQAVTVLGNSMLGSLDLSPTQNNLQIDFFGMDFRPGETLRYQWMLEGADKDWSSPTEQQTVNYANLNPGSYRFLVRAVKGDGLVSQQPAIVSFRILRPFWQRWWFIALAVLFVGGAAFVVVRNRVARLRERQQATDALHRSREERLRELERVRARIASDLHDDIGSSLTQISLLSEVVRRRVRHSDESIVQPLRTIASSSRDLVDAMGDIVWAINPQKDRLSDLSRRMRSLASDLFTMSGTDFRFSEPTGKDDLALGANLRREVFLIFKESINNIVKHSAASFVEIEFKVDQAELFLRVRDDGKGFDLNQDAEGHGLASMRSRSDDIGAALELISGAGGGTTMTLRVPLDGTSDSG